MKTYRQQLLCRYVTGFRYVIVQKIALNQKSGPEIQLSGESFSGREKHTLCGRTHRRQNQW